ncbi:MAG: hypothetical protein ILP17_11725 [Lachnospiraceae bacterium]|nr:hypothetical protein [Lachnospiraceae bacterium]MBP1586351.1 hypothetical protein [Lachnospiraceae bacterium]
MKKFRLLSAVLMLVMLFSLAGCGDQTIEGDWVLVKEVWGDGTVIDKDELEEEGIGETYHIEGSTVEYKCMVMGKEIGFDMELIENSDGTYTFQLGTLEFAVVTLKGNKFSYTVGEGHDASTMYFERQK